MTEPMGKELKAHQQQQTMSKNMNMHKRNVCGQSDTGVISRTLSRIILWWNGEHVERELYDALNECDTKREMLQMELDYLKGLMNETYYTEWKITKDGKRRYRKVATKVLTNCWRTQSESIEDIPMVKLKKPIQLFQSSYDLSDGYFD